jgi:hypothetical protein
MNEYFLLSAIHKSSSVSIIQLLVENRKSKKNYFLKMHLLVHVSLISIKTMIAYGNNNTHVTSCHSYDVVLNRVAFFSVPVRNRLPLQRCLSGK